MKLHSVLPFGGAAALPLALLGLVMAQHPFQPEVLDFERSGNQWFEGPLSPVRISNDGNWALLGSGSGSVKLYSLTTGREEPGALIGTLHTLSKAAFCGDGVPALAREGSRGNERGWFLPTAGREQLSNLPAGAVMVCSPDGSEIAYFDAGSADRKFLVGSGGRYRSYPFSGELTAMAFSPNGKMLYCLTFQPNGESVLLAVEMQTGKSRIIARDLDASPFSDSIAISPDGKYSYLALASDGIPNDEERHKPSASRWLKIYEMDLATGSRRRVVDSPGRDNTSPTIAQGNLYWARTVLHESIVILPKKGGEPKEIVEGGQFPMWNTDGSKIGYFFGGWRMADFGLNLDAATVSVDAEGNRTSEPSLIVSGYHEDFPPAWSPDGKWIAFHSHRSPIAVPAYASAGSTDDVYLRRADDIHSPEIRLTDFGWETGPAYWSPDGRMLLFVSYQRGGIPGIGKLWVIQLDTQKGIPLKSEMLPLASAIRSVRAGIWSPDGKEIAVEDDRGSGKRSLWIVLANGSHPEKLLDYESTTYGGLDWTRDGRGVIFSGLIGGRLQLFQIPRTGGAAQQLTRDSGNLMHPRVSPDGRRIACTQILQSKQIWHRPLY